MEKRTVREFKKVCKKIKLGHIQDSLKMIRKMEKENLNGMMALTMKVKQSMMLLRVMGKWFDKLETYMKVISKIMKWKEKESILGQMDKNTKASIKMVSNMVRENSLGITVLSLLVNISKVKKKVKESSLVQMEKNEQGYGKMTIWSNF